MYLPYANKWYTTMWRRAIEIAHAHAHIERKMLIFRCHHDLKLLDKWIISMDAWTSPNHFTHTRRNAVWIRELRSGAACAQTFWIRCVGANKVSRFLSSFLLLLLDLVICFEVKVRSQLSALSPPFWIFILSLIQCNSLFSSVTKNSLWSIHLKSWCLKLYSLNDDSW